MCIYIYIEYIYSTWGGPAAGEPAVEKCLRACVASLSARAIRRLTFTRYCHHQYCMVYGIKGVVGGEGYVAQ